MPNSAFSPSVFTAGGTTGQGEINLVTNPIAQFDALNWTTSSATLTRSSTGVLSPVIPTGFTASSTTSTTSYVQTSLLTVPATLRNRKLKVQLYIQCADTATWKVDVLKSDGSTRYTLSTDSSGVSALPALTGTYTTTFDMDTDSGIYVRLTRYAGAGTSTLSFTNVIAGPGIQPQGAVAQEWISYTPTGPWSTNTTYTGKYRRFGDSLELIIDLSLAGAPTTASLIFTEAQILNGLNLNVDATKFPVSSDFAAPVGVWSALDSGVSGNYGGQVTWNGSQIFAAYPTSTTTASVVNQAQPFTFGANDNISLRAVLPISQWSGSGTVQLAQNDVEYAYNTSTSTSANDTTSFAYGPSGAQIQSITAGLARTVRFQTPIQPSDKITLEVSSDQIRWIPAGGLFGSGGVNIDTLRFDGTNIIGAGVWNDSTLANTDVKAYFGKYSSGTTTSWATPAAYYWRLKKEKAGAAVGFGIVQPGVSSGLVSASGVPGNTTGNAIASGYVGENKATFGSGTSQPSGSNTPKSIVSVTLGAGVWLCQATVRFDKGTSDATTFGVGVSDTNNTMLLGYQTLGSVLSGATIYTSPIAVFTKTGSWTLYAVGNVVYTTLGSGAYDGDTANIKYIRIA